VAEVAPALGGGTDPLVARVKETDIAEVVEVAEGEIIDMMPGAYLFAFSKKTFSSKRSQPREELTFSQLTSSPCAYVSTMAPSAPCFTERPFIRRIGSSGVSNALASFFKSLFGISALCLGHNPMKIHVSAWLANSKISWTEIQFASSKLTAAMRESSSGCKDNEDTPVRSTQPRKQRQRKKAHISKHKSGQLNKRRERHGMHLQQEHTFFETFSCGGVPHSPTLLEIKSYRENYSYVQQTVQKIKVN
jgi:hypothetical protein